MPRSSGGRGESAVPKRDVEQRFRSFMSRRKPFSLLGFQPSELSAELHDLRIQAAAIEAQLLENDDKVLLAHVRRRFGDSSADAITRSAADAASGKACGAGGLAAAVADASAAGGAHPGASAGSSCAGSFRQNGEMSGAAAPDARVAHHSRSPSWGEGAKVGLAAAAGGTALLVLTSGIPVLAIGVGLVLVGGSAGAATASQWRKRKSKSAGAQVNAEEVAKWRAHVALLQEKLARSEAFTASVLAPDSLATLAHAGGAGGAGGLSLCSADGGSLPPHPPAALASAAAASAGKPQKQQPLTAAPAPRAAAAAAGAAAAAATPPRAGNGAPCADSQVPPLLREAFAQVRWAVRSDPNEWRLCACYGAARLLQHVHSGGQAPLCPIKAIVQVDAPPRSVRKMILDLRDGRRLWDASFEHGHTIDKLGPHSDIAHIVLSAVPHFSPFTAGHTGALVPLLLMSTALAADRDLVVWRHWVPLPPELVADSGDATTNVASSGGAGGGDGGGGGFIVVTASTLHAACPSVHGYERARCLLEAWVITPVAYSVRSEVTHFCSLEWAGWPGALARLSPALRGALHRPFFERLGALALHATATHGCLAVPLPRRLKAEGGDAADAGADGADGADGVDGDDDDLARGAGAARAADPTTGLFADIYQPLDDVPWQLRTAPTIGGIDGFSQPKAETFRVRSKGYLGDRVKLPSAPAAFDVANVYAWRMHETVRHVAAAPDSPLHRWRASGSTPPFTLVVNMIISGAPGFQGVFFFCMDEEEWSVHLASRAAMEAGQPVASASDAFHRLLAQFVKEDFSPEANRFRDERFKLLPAIVQGPMLLKNSSGNRPAILGTKLKQSYFAGPGYFEIDVDCASSHAAASVVNMVKGYCKTLVIDLAFILQGNCEDELPERVLCNIRFSRVDMSKLPLRPQSGVAQPGAQY